MKAVFRAVAVAFTFSAVLGGCAVYEPAPVYSQGPYYQGAPVYAEMGRPGPVYVQPAPVYVQPAPVYIEPPITFGFNFGYWSGGRHGWGGRRGWGGHGHHW